ncbi:MAG: hypothetical protein ACK5XN_05990 [Bacteroidota bacterium]|jgi:hypothetical protein
MRVLENMKRSGINPVEVCHQWWMISDDTSAIISPRENVVYSLAHDFNAFNPYVRNIHVFNPDMQFIGTLECQVVAKSAQDFCAQAEQLIAGIWKFKK